MQKSKVLAECY